MTTSNPLFWSKAREQINNRLFETNTNYIRPEEYIDFLRQDIRELENLLDDQKKNQKLEGQI